MGTFEDRFDIIPADVDPGVNPVVVKPDDNAEDTDFNYTRQNQVDLIEVSKAAVQTAMKVATESEHPKALESLAMILKTASELNRQLVLQSKDRAEAKAAKKGAGASTSGGTQIENAQNVTHNTIVMTGTMQEVLEELRKAKLNAAPQP